MPPKRKNSSVTRRRVMLGAGGIFAARFRRGRSASLFPLHKSPGAPSPSHGRLVRYMIEARIGLPPQVARESTPHSDSLAAWSGSHLNRAEAIRFVRSQGGCPSLGFTTDIRRRDQRGAGERQFRHDDET